MSYARLAAYAAAATISAATVSATAFAQASMTPPPPAVISPAPAGHPSLPKDMAAKIEARIAQLHTQLGITAAEQPQWDQFAQVMRENAAQMSEALTDRGAKVSGMNAIDTMQSYAKLAQVHADNMQKLSSAFHALYTTLPDQQKITADKVFRTGDAPGSARRG